MPEAPTEEMQGAPDAIGDWMKGFEPLLNPPTETTPPKDTNASPPPNPEPGAGTPPVGGSKTETPPVQAPVPPKPPEPPVTKADPKGKDEDEPRPKNQDDWDKYKSKRAEREAALKKDIEERDGRLKTLEAAQKAAEEKLSKAELSGASNQEIDRLKGELDAKTKLTEQLTEKIMVLDVREDPRFKAYFESKTNEQIALAKRIVGTEKAEAVAKALAIPDTEEYREYKEAELESILEGLSTFQQGRIATVMNALDGIRSERESEIGKANKHRETLSARETSSQKQALEARDRLFTESLKAMQDKEKGFAPFQLRDGDEQWNSGVRARAEVAKKLLTGEGMTPQDIVKSSFMAAAVPTILQSYKADIDAKTSEIAKLQEQVKSLTAATPSPKSTPAPGEQAPPRQLKQGATPDEALDNWIGSMQQEWSR